MSLDENHVKRKAITVSLLEGIVDPEYVVTLAPVIWRKWEEENVIPEGMTYEGFQYHLNQIALLTFMGRM